MRPLFLPTYTQDYTKLNAPRILQEVRGDFDLHVKVPAFPLPENNTSSAGKFSFISSGLLVWKDDKNFIRLERAAEGSSPAPFVWLERFQDGKAVNQQGKPVSDKDINLRVKRSGNKLTFSVGEDGSWDDIHAEEVELPQKLQVGVLAINTTTKVFSPQLEGLKLTPK
jgi:regulation of enolase protein 1 (concanavalin A-like superfamily)